MRFFFSKPPLKIPEGSVAAVRASVCTGERAAGFLDAKGRFEEVLLIRSEKDLDDFCRRCGVKKEELRRVW